MFDLALVIIVYCDFSINILLICARFSRRSFLLGTHSKGVYVIDYVFLVSFVHFSMADDFQDYIQQVHCFFFLCCLHCQYQDGIVFAKVSEKVFLESHFNSLL